MNGEAVEPPATGGAAPAEMLEVYYAEYRQLARKVLGRDSAARYIQPTELAHEAAVRLFKLNRMDISGRTHFLSISARVMRQVLIDEVRRFRAQKRQAPPVLTQWNVDPAPATFDIEDFHEALKRYEAVDPVRAKIVEQRFFAGLTVEEIAAMSGISESTIKRQWRVARAWLLNDLARE